MQRVSRNPEIDLEISLKAPTHVETCCDDETCIRVSLPADSPIHRNVYRET